MARLPKSSSFSLAITCNTPHPRQHLLPSPRRLLYLARLSLSPSRTLARRSTWPRQPPGAVSGFLLVLSSCFCPKGVSLPNRNHPQSHFSWMIGAREGARGGCAEGGRSPSEKGEEGEKGGRGVGMGMGRSCIGLRMGWAYRSW